MPDETDSSSDDSKRDFLIQLALEFDTDFNYSELWDQVTRVGLAGTPGQAGKATFDRLFQDLRSQGVFQPIPNQSSEGKKKPRLRFVVGDVRRLKGDIREKILQQRMLSVFISKPIKSFEEKLQSANDQIQRQRERNHFATDTSKTFLAEILRSALNSYISLHLFLLGYVFSHPRQSRLVSRYDRRASDQFLEFLTKFPWQKSSERDACQAATRAIWGSSQTSDELPDFVGKMWEEQMKRENERSEKALKIPDPEALRLIMPLIAGKAKEAFERSSKEVQIDLNLNPPRESETERTPNKEKIRQLHHWNKTYERILPTLLKSRHHSRNRKPKSS